MMLLSSRFRSSSGKVTQSIALAPGGLDATLTLEADEAMPAVLGWPPWFRRYLGA